MDSGGAEVKIWDLKRGQGRIIREAIGVIGVSGEQGMWDVQSAVSRQTVLLLISPDAGSQSETLT